MGAKLTTPPPSPGPLSALPPSVLASGPGVVPLLELEHAAALAAATPHAERKATKSTSRFMSKVPPRFQHTVSPPCRTRGCAGRARGSRAHRGERSPTPGDRSPTLGHRDP